MTRFCVGTCAKCKKKSSGVIESRHVEYRGNQAIRRRRMCGGCGYRWTTYEISQEEWDLKDEPIRKLEKYSWHISQMYELCKGIQINVPK